jgi:hypothetical protein
MPGPRERRWPKLAAGYALLVLVLAGVTAVAFETAGAAYQPLVLRLAVALLVGVVLLHIRRSYFRGDPLWDPPSEFEARLTPEPVAPKFDASLVKIRGELGDAVKSRAYFDRVLWPRLKAVAAANHPGGDEIAPPPKSRFAWRGPSPAVLAGLINRIEERR